MRNNFINRISALDLQQWADQMRARAELPRLVRLLIHSVPGELVSIDMPAGEGIQRHGWDGIVESRVGNAWLPAGLSGWEMGVDKDPRRKANEDYAARGKDALGLNPAQSCFIFVTPRSWPGKTRWVEEIRNQGQWREVRAYDAHDLEQWLEIASPAVSAWLGELMGKPIGELRSVRDWWSGFSASTDPPIPQSLVLAGREAAQQKLVDWFSIGTHSLEVRADSPLEAVAFVTAVLTKLPEPQTSAFQAQTLIVDSEKTWKSLLTPGDPLLLVMSNVDQIAAGQLIQAGHRIILPLGRNMRESDEALVLPRQPSREMAAALISIGFSESKSYAYVRASGRSLLALHRKLSKMPAIASPPWAQPEVAGILAVALLAGGWDEEAEGDRHVLEKLSGQTYADFSKSIAPWAHSSDPPLRHVGNVWRLAAPLDAWLLLGRYLGHHELTLFREAVMEVLKAPDPRFELPSEKRWVVNAYGKSMPFSNWLREGLAENLALLASHASQSGIELTARPEDWVNSIVTELLNAASPVRWGLIADLLPVLAEAAPASFLEAVEDEMAKEPPAVMSLFDEEGDFGGCPHSGLLWALENLAWNPLYLGRVTTVLGIAARLDPGGRWSNRPSSSMRDIFLPWLHHTAADQTEKLAVLDNLIRVEPQVGWELMISLLPHSHDTSSGTHEPRWRDWAQDVERSISVHEHSKYVLAIADRLMNLLGNSGSRRADLLGCVADPRFPEEYRKDLLTDFQSFSHRQLNEDERIKLWTSLREMLHHHRQFPDADWSLSSDELDRFRAVYGQLEPTDPIDRFGWLFAADGWPHLPEGQPEDYDEYQHMIERARNAAVKDVYVAGGIGAVIRLANEVHQNVHFAVSAAKMLSQPDVEDCVINEGLGNQDDRLANFARVFVATRRESNGQAWFEQQLERAQAEGWPSVKVVDLLLSLPQSMETWHRIRGLGAEIEENYWMKVPLWRLENSIEQLEYAVKHLLKAGRARRALDLVRFAKKPSLPFNLLAEILEQLIVKQSERDHEQRLSGYEVEPVFRAIDIAVDIDENRVVRLEWNYLSVLERSKRGPRLLHRALENEPAFFAEVVQWIFRPRHGELEDVNLDAQTLKNRASLAYRLLDCWRGLPGASQSTDEASLWLWVQRARAELVASDRQKIGDQKIGQVLARSPIDSDEVWPAVNVRKVIEELRNRDIEIGIVIGVMNGRGVTSREWGAGGEQERDLESRYREWASTISTAWPRTSRLLNQIADSYASDARRWDQSADRDDLRYG